MASFCPRPSLPVRPHRLDLGRAKLVHAPKHPLTAGRTQLCANQQSFCWQRIALTCAQPLRWRSDACAPIKAAVFLFSWLLIMMVHLQRARWKDGFSALFELQPSRTVGAVKPNNSLLGFLQSAHRHLQPRLVSTCDEYVDCWASQADARASRL